MDFDKTVYIEASVVFYLTAVVSSNPSKIARHYASAGWLDFWGPGFELFTSALAIEGSDIEHRRDGALPEALEGVTKEWILGQDSPGPLTGIGDGEQG